MYFRLELSNFAMYFNNMKGVRVLAKIFSLNPGLCFIKNYLVIHQLIYNLPVQECLLPNELHIMDVA